MDPATHRPAEPLAPAAPAAPPSPSPSPFFGGAAQRRTFWALFVLVAGMSVAPFWGVSWIPMTDLGGHVELMDIAARYDAPETVYSDYYVLSRGWEPNRLTTLAARLLSPLLNAHTTAKLLLSLYVLGLALSSLLLCRAFGRSPWLAFFSFPLAFNFNACMGFLNFLLGLPAVFLMIYCAKGIAERPTWRRFAWLAAAAILAYFAHVLTFMVGTAMAAFVLLTYGRGRALRRGAAALSIALVPFVIWVLQKIVFGRTPSGGRAMLAKGGGLGATYSSRDDLIAQVHDVGLNYFRGSGDEWLLLALLALLFLLHALSVGAGDRRPDPGPVGGGWRATVARRPIEWMTFFVAVAYVALPSHFAAVAVIAERVVIIALLLLTLWPRVDVRRRSVRVVVGALVVVAAGYPLYVLGQFRVFDREVARPVEGAIAGLPQRSFLAYVIASPGGTHIRNSPTRHLPKAMHALLNGGVTDDSFARNATNPIQYRPGKLPPRPRKDFWHRKSAYRQHDYLLYRSPAPPPRGVLKGFADLIFHDGWWWLYKIQPEPQVSPRTPIVGGPGGDDRRWACGKDEVISGLRVWRTDVVASVEPVCRRPAAGGAPARERVGCAFGRKGGRLTVLGCRPDRPVVGLRVSHARFLEAIDLLCGDPLPRDEVGPPAPSEPRAWGHAQEKVRVPAPAVMKKIPAKAAAAKKSVVTRTLRCPGRTVATGVRVRAGAVVDAIGLTCTAPGGGHGP